MKRMRHGLLPLALLLAGCQVRTAQVARPALLLAPDVDARQELRQAVMELSGFARVDLQDNDLTRSSTLVVERRQQHAGNGELIQGRDLELPQRFQLQIQDGQCWLLHLRSGQRKLLQRARCRLEDNLQQ